MPVFACFFCDDGPRLVYAPAVTDVLNSDALRTTIFTVAFGALNAIAFGALFPSEVLPLLGVAVKAGA